MLILTSRFLLPIYLIPILYYFLKFFFISTVVLAVFVMICTSAAAASTWKIQQNTSLKFRPSSRYERFDGYYNGADHHGSGIGSSHPDHCHYTNTWVSFIEGDSYSVQKMIEKHGYVILTEIFPNTYHLHHPNVEKRSRQREEYYSRRLTSQREVLYAKQLKVQKRIKRDLIMLTPFRSSKWRKDERVDGEDGSVREFRNVNSSQRILSRSTFAKNDPKWPDMWYLNRGGERDMNVRGAWEDGYSGLGIVVTILDDGLEKDHPDLIVNYDPQASYDINGHDEDPMPRYDPMDSNRHGTRCAGEVAAAANNNRCSVGVAFRASIGGIRMLDGDVTDAVEARSLNLNSQHIDIYSASWGPDDDGKTVDGPGELATRAFVEGVTKGRGGKGSIFVWASGNGGRDYDNCNCDGYTNSIYTLSVSSATEAGKIPWYSEICSSTIASTYSSGALWEPQVSTTDLHHDCTGNHTGTSASAPLAAGISALALEANTELTWRDMQHIVIATARPKGLKAADWNINGVGRAVSHSFGYGLMDATAMVRLARAWKRVGAQLIHQTEAYVENAVVPPYGVRVVRLYIQQTSGINFLEHVQARITLNAKKRGDMRIILISPAGTRSVLLTPRARDNSRDGFRDWPFMTVHCWGEKPFGTWKLELHNQGKLLASLLKWSLILYGTADSPADQNNLFGSQSDGGGEKKTSFVHRTKHVKQTNERLNQADADENDAEEGNQEADNSEHDHEDYHQNTEDDDQTTRFESVKNIRNLSNSVTMTYSSSPPSYRSGAFVLCLCLSWSALTHGGWRL